MPKKSSDKEKRAGKRRNSRNRGSENEENQAPKKKKVTTKNKPSEGISKSRQLIEKIQKSRSTRASTSRKHDRKICPNGKPMPSLADLERMYSDSEDPQQETSPRPKTPEQNQPNKLDIQISPNKIKKIASNLYDMLDKLATGAAHDDDGPPIAPPKKRKKPVQPYIVDCKDRQRKEWRPKSNFCKGHGDYGVDTNTDSSEEDCPKKSRARSRSSKLNISKSIFNAKSDEIAARLQQYDCQEPGNSSPDSNKTVEYDYTHDPPSQMPRSFSPLPSTSRDNDTILKNEQRFNESLKPESFFDDSSQNDVEIIEDPCDIVVVDDTLPSRHAGIVQPLMEDTDDDCCIIVPSENTSMRENTSPIRIDSPKDKFYGPLNLNQKDENYCEIIDVDDLIAENEAKIKKFHKNSNFDTITLIEPSTYTPRNQDRSQANTDDPPANSSSTHSLNTVDNQSFQIHANEMPLIDSDAGSDIYIDPNIIEIEIVRNSATSPNVSNIPDHDYNSSNEDNILATSGPMDIFSVLSTLERFISNRSHHRRGRTPNRRTRTINAPRQHSSRHNTTVTNTVGSHNFGANRIPYDNVNFTVTNITCVPANQSPNTTEEDDTQKDTLPNRPEQDRNSQSAQNCPICLDSLSNKAAASTFCGHIFCMACIKAAIKANGKKCPTCRKALKNGVGYHPLFL